MKRAACDEQNVVGLHHAVLGVDRGAFDERQQIALHALTRHFATARFVARRDLVDFVEKHDAVLLDVLHSLGFHLFVVEHLAGFFVGEDLERFLHLQLAARFLAAADVREHRTDLLGHVFHARRPHDVHAHLRLFDVEFDFLVVEQAFAQTLAEGLARGAAFVRRVDGARARAETHRPGARQQNVEDAVFGLIFGLGPHFAHFRLARLLD